MRIQNYTKETHDKVIECLKTQFVGVVKKPKDRFCFYIAMNGYIANITEIFACRFSFGDLKDLDTFYNGMYLNKPLELLFDALQKDLGIPLRYGLL